ncbi:MAG: hypothetical protein ACYST2_04755, partial [Planctomycetota bacterium]
MTSSLLQAAAQTSATWNLVLLFGVIVFLGTFGSRFAQRIRIPQVVGCVLVGVVLGPDVFNF